MIVKRNIKEHIATEDDEEFRKLHMALDQRI
jgi:hypothetical protein